MIHVHFSCFLFRRAQARVDVYGMYLTTVRHSSYYAVIHVHALVLGGGVSMCGPCTCFSICYVLEGAFLVRKSLEIPVSNKQILAISVKLIWQF